VVLVETNLGSADMYEGLNQDSGIKKYEGKKNRSNHSNFEFFSFLIETLHSLKV